MTVGDLMNIGILGAGSIASIFADMINHIDEANAYAVAARDIERANAFKDKFSFEKAYGSYEEMLSDPNVELVYIATPHSHHAEHAKLCIENIQMQHNVEMFKVLANLQGVLVDTLIENEAKYELVYSSEWRKT